MAWLLASVPPPVKTISSGSAPSRLGDLLAGASRRRRGPLAVGVRAGRVAEVLRQVRQHRLADGGVDRGGRVVVEVDRPAVVHAPSDEKRRSRRAVKPGNYAPQGEGSSPEREESSSARSEPRCGRLLLFVYLNIRPLIESPFDASASVESTSRGLASDLPSRPRNVDAALATSGTPCSKSPPPSRSSSTAPACLRRSTVPLTPIAARPRRWPSRSPATSIRRRTPSRSWTATPCGRPTPRGPRL